MLALSQSGSAQGGPAQNPRPGGLLTGLALALALLVACGGSRPASTATNTPKPHVSRRSVTEFALPTPESHPSGITAAPDGKLWCTENAGNKIGVFKP